MGLSASTGDLTDQHDVTWLGFFAESTVADAVASGEWGGIEAGTAGQPVGGSGDMDGRRDGAGAADVGDLVGDSSDSEGPSGIKRAPLSPSDVEEALRSAGVVQFLQRQAEEDRAQVRGLRKELEARVSAVGKHFEETLGKVQRAEEALAKRLEAV